MTKNKTVDVDISKIVGKGYSKYWNDKSHRYCVVKGGRGSKKSKTTALWIIVSLLKYPLSNCLVVRRYYNTLYDSVFSDLKWAMNKLNVSHLFEVQKSPLRIVHKTTGQQVIFRGMDSMESLTSISVTNGYLNFCWLEEASQVEDEQMFNMLDLSIRGDLPKGYFYRFNITFNPWSDKHWLKSRFFDVESDSILALTTTYRCNEWIGDDFIRMMEEMRVNNPRRYRIEGDGEFGISEGLVYENVEMRYFDVEEISKNSSFKACYGLDFGFNDPTTLCCFYISKETKEIYVFDEFYKSRVTNKDITQMLVDKGLNNERIICDSAEPKSIEELKRLGIPLATPCVKGKGSVDYGIQLVQNYKIVVNPRCEEFIREISNYNYLPSGKTNHDFSHLMDALRYGVMWYERGLPKAKTRLRKNWFV